jgi:predicted nuclease with TOPRIM domain
MSYKKFKKEIVNEKKELLKEMADMQEKYNEKRWNEIIARLQQIDYWLEEIDNRKQVKL